MKGPRALGVAIGVALGALAAAAQAGPPGGQIASEVDIAEVQRAVAAREDRPELQVAVRASRWAYVLPTRVGVRVRRDDDNDQTSTFYDDDGWRRRASIGDHVEWRVDLEWDLSRIVHNPGWAAAVRARDQARRRRDSTVDLATRLYYERRRLQVQFIRAREPPEVRDRLWIQVAELTARLDVLTGGLMTRRAVRWWLPPDDPEG